MKKNRPKLLLTAAVEKRSENLKELESIHKVHYDEISDHRRHGIDLNPNNQEYLILEQKGILLHVALRHAGKIVGYFDGFVKTGLHYQDCLTLQMDIIFICMSARGQNAGPLLLNAVEQEAHRRGVRLWTMGHKISRAKHMRKLLLDYKPIYFKNGFLPFETHYAMWSD